MTLLIDMLVDVRDVRCSITTQFSCEQNPSEISCYAQTNIKFEQQRHTKVPLHLGKTWKSYSRNSKMQISLKKRVTMTRWDHCSLTLLIYSPKNNYVMLVIDARYFNSATDLSKYSWPLEPVQTVMTRVYGKFLSMSDLSFAYH